MTRLASAAVMQRRHEPAASLDFFPTPPWATRALCEHVLPLADRRPLDQQSVWEPACGEGHMAAVLTEYFERVSASDIFDYGYGEQLDFLGPIEPLEGVDWIITNPPFKCAEEFIRNGLARARIGVAMIVRLAFLEGDGRYERLFKHYPPAIVAQFIERVPMHRGRWEPNGTTATAYCWIVWRVHPPHDRIRYGTEFAWIPKSRKSLTRPDDALRFAAATPAPLFGEEV